MAMSVSMRLGIGFVAVVAGFAMTVIVSARFMPVGTGFTVFVTFCFGMAGARHGGFLVRFVV
ncbi:hypothetical protein [Paraburkholderia sp. SIMBA_030]|uniref:hypothetical protein n=1 Tax=Paraburkholderia sp. SIMBA_030 TaxID=3085773 RepID=UPI00397C5200